jgi:hypothetical protein
MPARIGSAAAVLRRVVEDSTRRGVDRALTDGRSRCSILGRHLGPEEPGELSGNGGGNDGADVLVGGQLVEPPPSFRMSAPFAA